MLFFGPAYNIFAGRERESYCYTFDVRMGGVPAGWERNELATVYGARLPRGIARGSGDFGVPRLVVSGGGCWQKAKDARVSAWFADS